MDVTNRNIVMLGAGSSVGNLIYKNLAEQGHSITGVGLDGPNIPADFLEYDAYEMADLWDRVERETLSMTGTPIDTLIINSGITRINPIEDHTMSDFDDVVRLNMYIPFAMIKGFIKHVKDSIKCPDEAGLITFGERHAKVIYTSSMGVHNGLRHSPGYVASKAGVEALMRSLSRELAEDPFTFLTVAPGSVSNTNMINQVAERMQEVRDMSYREAFNYIANGTPMKRMMCHEEVWKIFDFAVNQAPQYMSGTTLKCPGGTGNA